MRRGQVISGLAENKSAHIPFRNSKLTFLLKDSLSGNSKTFMVEMWNLYCALRLLWVDRLHIASLDGAVGDRIDVAVRAFGQDGED